MALFVIADLHLSLGTDKPMDKFSGWEDYVGKLSDNWHKSVKENDTVVIPGDISWAMRLENTVKDFSFIDALPGKKVLMKGNHDYWWNTKTKMEAFVAKQGFSSIVFLHNDCVISQNIAICGTRGWLFEDGQPHDQKVMAREVGRLTSSLQMAEKANPGLEKVVFLHYPPLYQSASSQELLKVMADFGVKRCYYGHLHSASIRYATQGMRGGIKYSLISADALGFNPLEVTL